MMKTHFWDIESTTDHKTRQRHEALSRNLKRTYIVFMCLHFPDLVAVTCGPYLMGELIVVSYEPICLPFRVHYLFQAITMTGNIFVPVVAADVLFLSVVTLTYGQFIILSNEIKNIFEPESIPSGRKIVMERMRRCINHHRFLLE